MLRLAALVNVNLVVNVVGTGAFMQKKLPLRLPSNVDAAGDDAVGADQETVAFIQKEKVTTAGETVIT